MKITSAIRLRSERVVERLKGDFNRRAPLGCRIFEMSFDRVQCYSNDRRFGAQYSAYNPCSMSVWNWNDPSQEHKLSKSDWIALKSELVAFFRQGRIELYL